MSTPTPDNLTAPAKPRSLLAEFLGSEEAAKQYRSRADMMERWRLRASLRTVPDSSFDAGDWSKRAASRTVPKLGASLTPETVRAIVRTEVDEMGRVLRRDFAKELPDAVLATLESVEA